MTLRYSGLATLAAAALLAASAPRVAAQTTPSCWNPNLGSSFPLSDDQLQVGLTLGFPFPMPGGGTTTSIDVCSNGYVWLVSGSSTAADYTPTVTELLSDPPRIAPAWTDLNPGAGGSVHFQSTATEAVVTWLDVPEFSSGGINTVQLQMFPDGSFIVTHRSLNLPGTHNLILGGSAGNGAADPGEIDYSTLPHLSNGIPTVYEEFVSGTDPRDTVGSAFYFIPDGQGGYIVAPLGPCADYRSFGQGCPGFQTTAVYEFFDITGLGETLDVTGNFAMEFVPTGNGGFQIRACTQNCWEPNYGTNLGLGDDQVSAAQPLGFTGVYGGVVTSQVKVSSNGFIYLRDGTSSGCCSGDVAAFLANEPRIAVLWTDLNPFTGGQVLFNALPGRAVVTWDQVPEFGQAGTQTMQAQLFADGRIILTYQQTAVTNHNALVGFSGGGGVADPGESDFTAQLPITTGGTATPLTLASGSGTPVLGATFNMTVGAIPSGSPFGAVLLGFVSPNLPLDPIGMTGCTLLAAGDASLTFSPGGSPTATVGLRVPNLVGIAGFSVYAQGFAIAPGANPLGIAASNGGELIPGF